MPTNPAFPMMSRVLCTLLLPAAFAACNLIGGSDSGGDGQDCQAGTELCECLGGTTCTAGLVCANGFCVTPGSGGTGNPTTSDATASDDGSTSAGSGVDDADGTDADGTASGGMEDGGPVIVDFGTNVTAITQQQSVIFTATVTDIDGPDDLQGGSLKNADGTINFGAFTDLGDGTYSTELSWDAIHQAMPINFDEVGTRTFRAEFFDNSGKMAWQTTDIDLTCGPGGCAWDGVCKDAQTDNDHCGSCGNACEVVSNHGHCVAGECTPTYTDCIMASNPLSSCDEVCAMEGSTCEPCQGETWVGLFFDEPSCLIYTSQITDCSEPVVAADSYYLCCCAQ